MLIFTISQYAVMPPKTKKKRQNLRAPAKGREVLKQSRLERDQSVFAAMPIMEGVTSGSVSIAHAVPSGILHEEPGPSLS